MIVCVKTSFFRGAKGTFSLTKWGTTRVFYPQFKNIKNKGIGPQWPNQEDKERGALFSSPVARSPFVKYGRRSNELRRAVFDPPLAISSFLSPPRPLYLSFTFSLSLSLKRTHGPWSDRRRHPSNGRTTCPARAEMAEMVGHDFPAAQSTSLAAVGCDSSPCSAVLQPVLVANVGANQFLSTSSS